MESKKKFRRRLAAWLIERKVRGRRLQVFAEVGGGEPWAAPGGVFLARESWGWSGWVA